MFKIYLYINKTGQSEEKLKFFTFFTEYVWF